MVARTSEFQPEIITKYIHFLVKVVRVDLNESVFA